MSNTKTGNPKKISLFIQHQLHVRKLKNVDPVTATYWLIKEGLQGQLGSRPGSYLRSLCRKGLIDGTEKTGSKWKIRAKKKR